MIDWLPAFLITGIFGVVQIIGLGLLVHLQMGLTRVANFGVAGFWGLGLYTFGITYTKIDWPFGDPFQFLICAVLATLAASLAGLFVAWIISDLDVDGALVGTLGFATVIFLLATAMNDLTGGATGLGGLGFPYDFGTSKTNEFIWLLLTAAIVIGILVYVLWVHRSPYGRLLIAVGTNEPLARSLGKSSTRAKLMLFALTSGVMGLLGVLQAVMFRFIIPANVTIIITLTTLAALILGGITRPWGAVVGVLFTVALFDIVVQFYAPLPQEWFNQAIPVAREAIFGLAIVLVLLFRPKGMLGEMKRPQLMRRVHGND